ncbi:MAG: TonB-dependent receptor [Bryobacteraceae bacterium]|jgi:iron complex outermembrane receptor protein
MLLARASFRSALLVVAAASAWSQTGLSDASLEQLLQVQVTSVSKKEQKLARTAAAVFVISQEDIRRSGASTLPDVLRMAPGVNVAQINANTWAVSIRGFNSRYSDKVLVLVDGRSVYTPDWGGPYWDQLEMPLEDIDRIEVIRGPGASVWGANAVNGVINIITKSSQATQGGLGVASGGNHGGGAGLQYGGVIPGAGTYRAYTQYSRTGDSIQANGSSGDDGWWRMHGGFRWDWDFSPADTLMMEGDLFSNRESQARYQFFTPSPTDVPFAQRFDAAGGSLLSRWNHTFAGGSDTTFQAYYDTYRRTDIGQPEALRTFDLDFQHHRRAGNRHDIVWGLGFRAFESAIPAGYQIAIHPPVQTGRLFSAFFQDEIHVANNLWLTVGAKLEHQSHADPGLEPSLRLAWTPNPRQTLWAAASQAIRQPTRAETSVDAQVSSTPAGPGFVVNAFVEGNPHLMPEQLRDYEAGYRLQWTNSLSLDGAAFAGFYHHLATIEPLPPLLVQTPSQLQMLMPFLYYNRAHAFSRGGELVLNWSAAAWWRISPSYALVDVDPRLDPNSADTSLAQLTRGVPESGFQLRSFLNLTRRVEWDQTFYWTTKVESAAVPHHARLDMRIGWRAGEHTEISLVGQNLVGPRFFECGANAYQIVGTALERSLFGKVTWHF